MFDHAVYFSFYNGAIVESARAWRGFTIDFTFYKVLIIMLVSLMFMADLCYIPKIACVFSKPNKVQNSCN